VAAFTVHSHQACNLEARSNAGPAPRESGFQKTFRGKVAVILFVAPLPMPIAATKFKHHPLYCPAIVSAALENCDPSRLRYFPQQLSSQPILLSSRLRVEHDVLVRD